MTAPALDFDRLKIAADYVIAARLDDRPADEVLDHLQINHTAHVWDHTIFGGHPRRYIRAEGVGATSDLDDMALLSEWSMNAIMRLRKAGIRL